jgi:hypothetical protein
MLNEDYSEHINLLADDTLTSVSAKTAIEAHTKMNDVLNRVSSWLKLNRLNKKKNQWHDNS